MPRVRLPGAGLSPAMSVLVKLSTTLRDRVDGYRPELGLDVPYPFAEENSAETLALHIGLPLSEIKIVMVNGRMQKLSCPVEDGDRVAYFPAVGGG